MKYENKLHKRELTPRAQKLRKEMTEEERHLWYAFLKEYPVQFKRQKPISIFIADFYCPQAKLVIEVDGSQHYTEQGEAYDTDRTAVINEFGIEVLRFSNYDVNNSFDSVCKMIDLTVKKRIETLSEK